MSKILLINTGKTQYVEGTLNWMTDGSNMFYQCYNLTSFNSDLSSLTNGNYMFGSCYNLTTFSSDLSSLTNGTSMFNGCSCLTSFNCNDLSSLATGSNMFSGCSALTSFNSDLSSLTTGTSMFGSSSYNCTALNLTSIENISETINDLDAQGKRGTIHIGISKNLKSDDVTAPINVALAAIRAKGWTVNELYSSKL